MEIKRDAFGRVVIDDKLRGSIRQFESGATRDADENKPSYARFESALVSKRFAEYMQVHRVQSDGGLRAPDNWKKGIPRSAYFESMDRHFQDLKLIEEGFEDESRDSDEEALCAIIFNARGMLFEILKEKRLAKRVEVICDGRT